MALTDINFQEAEGQDFVVEIVVGTLNVPNDILVETETNMYPVVEVPAASGGGNIFIMSE